jgi:hypothetical protein
MAKFALTKDFDSAKAPVKGTDSMIELVKLDSENYAFFGHNGDNVAEIGCYNKEELRTIWQLLTISE